MTAKAQARSITQRLSNIARERGVPFKNVMAEFLIERLLARLVRDSNLDRHLIFKGGFVGFKIYQSTRYTFDLDAILEKVPKETVLQKIKEVVQKESDDCTWFRLQEEIDLETQGEYGGTRFVFRAGVGELLEDLKRAQIINFDLGMGDPVTPGPKAAELKPLLSDIELSWKIYPIETIVAEKIHALVVRGSQNSRSKDIFDLHRFLPQASAKNLRQALAKTFEYRTTSLPEDLHKHLKAIDITTLERGWRNAIQDTSDSLDCRQTFDLVLKELKSLLE